MINRASIFILTCFAILTLGLLTGAEAQTRRKSSVSSKPSRVPIIAKQIPPAAPSPAPPKRNERPTAEVQTSNNRAVGSQVRNAAAAYLYEFSQPDFVVSSIKIEHDESGAGTITFRKKGGEEPITDPIVVSARSIARINEALAALNFLDSNENYQYEKDFSHLGSMRFARTAGGKTRETAFNYTSNKDAKVLMDEYRKIGNQYIWIFDIKLSRENQPLDAPRLLDSLDSLIRRNEISDPQQMEPFLRLLSDDESIPLIARNHAARLVKQFEKERAKIKKKEAASN